MTTALKSPRRRSRRRIVSPSPHLMNAAAMDRSGPPSVLKVRPVPMPKPGPNEILIALTSAGVGIWDTEIRQGWWPAGKPRYPLILGVDGAGIVADKGARVRRFSTGDRVWAYAFINPKGGFYSEFVAVDAESAGPIPSNLDLLAAGASAATGLTAFQGVHDHLRVRNGETVMVFGASGAVGSLAVQFAKHQGARVIGIARGRDAAALVRRLGADIALDATEDDFVDRVRDAAGDGIDGVLTLAGGDRLEACLDLVRNGGRVVHPHGVEPAPHRRKHLRVVSYDAQSDPRRFAALKAAAEACDLQVPLGGVFPLEQAAKAHEMLEKEQVLGRLALKIRR